MDNRLLFNVKAFHKAFRIKPGPHDTARNKLRAALLMEEAAEFDDAARIDDYEAMLDALVDLQYILLGTVHLLRMEDAFHEAWGRVHRANMRKLPDDGTPLLNGVTVPLDATKPFGKILKPLGWEAPKLTDLVEDLQREVSK